MSRRVFYSCDSFMMIRYIIYFGYLYVMILIYGFRDFNYFGIVLLL